MEFYDTAFTQQLLPLLSCVLGSGPAANPLKKFLDKAQPTHDIWDNTILKNRILAAKFRVAYNSNESQIEQRILSHKSQVDEHSPLSPFNAQSDLFPSGVICSKWFRKYVMEVPFAVVCVYDLSINEDEDLGLAEELSALRSKYLSHNTRFIAIIYSGIPGDVKKRLANLRQISGLANSQGFFHLQVSADYLDADCEELVSSLLASLKHSATDYYSSIESRVRQRSTKYYTMPRSDIKTSIELSPKILETRILVKQGILLQLMHPYNVAPALRVLETCYEHCFGLISHNLLHFFSKSRSPHDLKVYVQLRTLLDVLAIHLVRGYFSVEQPVSAMKRHQSHIQCVVQLLIPHHQFDLNLWVAIQKHWLAELLAHIPDSALQELYKPRIGNEKKSGSVVEYFGGVTVDQTPIITSPSLIYHSAANTLDYVSGYCEKIDIFSDYFESTRDILRYKVKLLESARCLTSSTSVVFASSEIQYLSEIGDTWVDLEYYKEAIEVFKLAQEKCLLPSWSGVHDILARKIIYVAEKLENANVVLEQLAGLSLRRSKEVLGPSKPVELSKSSSIEFNTQCSLVSAEVSVFGKSLDEARVADIITTQIKINSEFDPALFNKMCPGCDSTISLNYIEVLYEHGASVRCTGEGNQTETIQKSMVVDNHASFDFTGFGEESLILHLEEEALKCGWIRIISLIISVSVSISINSQTLILNKKETVALDQGKIAHTFVLYQKDENGVAKVQKKLNGRSPYALFVKPFRPNLNLELGKTPKSLVIGEKVQIPVTLSFPEKLKASGCNSIKLVGESIIYHDMIETKGLHAHVNWDGLKDDEPIELVNGDLAKSPLHVLHVKITKPPSARVSEERLKIVVYFKLVVGYEGSEASEFAIKQLGFELITKPFSETFEILPRFLHTSSSTNPFLLDSSPASLSMPHVSRAWLLRMNRTKCMLPDDIDVVSVQLHLRSANPGVTTTWMSEALKGESTHSREFKTNGEHHPTTSTVKITANANYVYKRKGADNENLFETPEKEFVLPLQDPRVLLRVTSSEPPSEPPSEPSSEPSSEKLSLSFLIENPTSRIFTFSSTLSTDGALNKGVVWTFNDVRNESSLKQAIIPVLPFSQHELNYHGTYETKDTSGFIALPQLLVYDMHYKKSLPTIPLQDSIKVTETGMFLKI